jgi:hypothetical protein
MEECFMNLRTGDVSCFNAESVGELPSRARAPPFSFRGGVMPYDSPLNRILQREPVGPWTLIAYITTDAPSMAQSRDRTMMLYAQTVDTRRDRYNLRAVDSNGTPLDIGEKVNWPSDGSTIAVPGQSVTYTVHLYAQYK